jgi:hypothetical protein
MATAPLTYVAGTDRETLKANQAYQDALTRLTESLEGRKNRMFDPQLLALAEGLLTPGRTGSFFEGLGTAAGKMRAAEELEEKRAQEIAQAQLGLAEKGLSLAQMRQREKMYRELLGGQPGELPSGAPAGAAPSAPPTAPATRPTAPQEGTPQAEFARIQNLDIPPPGMSGPNVKFIQLTQPTGTMLSERGFLLQSMLEGRPISDAMDKARQFNKDRYQFRDNRSFDSVTGRLYFYDTGETVKVSTSKGEMTVPRAVAMEGQNAIEAHVKGLPGPAQIAGDIKLQERVSTVELEPKTVNRMFMTSDGFKSYEIPEADAIEFDRIVRKNGINSPQAALFAQRFTGETPAGGGRVPTGTERDIERESELDYRRRMATQAADQEAQLPAQYENARSIPTLTDRVSRLVDASGNFVGLLARPGYGPAILSLIGSGVQTPRGTISFPGIDAALRAVAPNVTKQDITNVELIGADLSELELKYTQTYLAKQGAVTEGERRIVRALPGSVLNSAEMIRTRMDLIDARAKFDQRSIEAFRDWKENNPKKTILDWKATKEYSSLLDDFEKKSSQIADRFLPQPGATRTYQGKKYQYVGPRDDVQASRNPANWRVVNE